MATYKQGILGSFSGKVGNVVGASWRGTAYMRSLPKAVRNPKTQKQVEARNRLSAVVAALKPFKDFIRAGFVKTSSVSPWSTAIKANIPGRRRQLDPTAHQLRAHQRHQGLQRRAGRHRRPHLGWGLLAHLQRRRRLLWRHHHGWLLQRGHWPLLLSGLPRPLGLHGSGHLRDWRGFCWQAPRLHRCGYCRPSLGT